MRFLDDIVGFKNRKIYQDRDFFCFNLDSLLLSYFTEIKKSDENILELGVGNGVNLLILSKKYSNNFVGIDIQKENIELAKESIKYNGLDDRITIYQMNIIDAYKKLGNNKYDVILCNPPYFEKSSSTKNHIKAVAKSKMLISLEDIVKETNKLLNNGGRLYMVYPTTGLDEILLLSNKYNLKVKKIRYVYYDKSRESKIMLLKICKNGKRGLSVDKPLILFDNKEKTEEYRRILGEIDD